MVCDGDKYKGEKIGGEEGVPGSGRMVALLRRVVREGLVEKGTFVQRPEGSDTMAQREQQVQRS